MGAAWTRSVHWREEEEPWGGDTRRTWRVGLEAPCACRVDVCVQCTARMRLVPVASGSLPVGMPGARLCGLSV